MGQQQFLIIALMVFVGAIAVFSVVSYSSQSRRQSMADGLKHSAFVIAEDARSWYARPTPEGGGLNPSHVDADEPTWDQLGVKPSQLDGDGNFRTDWGVVEKATGGDGSVQLKLLVNGIDAIGEVNFTPDGNPEIQFDPIIDGAPPSQGAFALVPSAGVSTSASTQRNATACSLSHWHATYGTAGMLGIPKTRL